MELKEYYLLDEIQGVFFKFSAIYKWENIINRKVYIGQAVDLSKRFYYYRKGEFNDYMSKAIKKYGIENFHIFILEHHLSRDVLDEREQYWMDYYRSYDRDHGYNLAPTAGSQKGYKFTEESRERLSAAKTATAKHGVENPLFGRKQPDEVCRILSEARRRNKVGWKRVCKIDPLTGDVLQTFESIQIAAAETGCSACQISQCIHGNAATASCFLWAFEGALPDTTDARAWVIASADGRHVRPFLKIDPETNDVVGFYIRNRDAYGYRRDGIYAACKSYDGPRYKAYGYYWRYTTDKEIEDYFEKESSSKQRVV